MYGKVREQLFIVSFEMFTALPTELNKAGFESGHAYGKSLRTVKSCVGTTCTLRFPVVVSWR
jgi:NAD(P)H-nitrite reductase large subunit